MEAYNLLNHKQKLFIDYMIKYGNQSKAYKEAGYSPKNADINASRLIRNEKVAKALQEKKQALYKDLNITEDDLKAFWKQTLYDNQAKLSDRIRISELLAQYLGIFKQNETKVAIFQMISKDDVKRIEQEAEALIEI